MKAGAAFFSLLYRKQPSPFIYSSNELKYLLSSYHGLETVLGSRETSYKRKRKTRFLSAFDDGGGDNKKEANK